MLKKMQMVYHILYVRRPTGTQLLLLYVNMYIIFVIILLFQNTIVLTFNISVNYRLSNN
jgi:hypothetical protein